MSLSDHTRDLGNGMAKITDLNGFLGALRQSIGPTLAEHEEVWEREGPAIKDYAASMGITITMIGGNCPVQAEGDFDGKRFYFRARGEEWQFHVADDDDGIFGPDEWMIERDYGTGPFDAGWMHKHEAVAFICEGVVEYRAASGMEAPTGGETAQTGSTEGDSPTGGAGDAQGQSHD